MIEQAKQMKIAHKKAAQPARVLVADDQEIMRETVSDMLTFDGYNVTTFDPVEDDLEVLARPYDVVILDMVMPNIDGLAVREEVMKYSPWAQIIIVTAYADKDTLDRVMDLGVYTFIAKPFSGDHIRYAVLGALRNKHLYEQKHASDVQLESERQGLVGTSDAVTDVRRRILEFAPLDVPVLLTGQSGTGKEVVSRCIHSCSTRAEAPFTPLNCAGLSANLVESELFGHAQGAFTGATHTKHGYFEVSDGGTVFLDEIGDLPLELQSRLLRVLDRGEFSRVGETEVRKVDVRILSATNRDLWSMVQEGSFRADLYYRLRGAHIELEPLNQRREDIPRLVQYMLSDTDIVVAPQAMNVLMHHDWNGNVRELAMIVKGVRGIAKNSIVTAEDVCRFVKTDTPPGEQQQSQLTYRQFKDSVLKGCEKQYFEDLVRSVQNNIAQAAQVAGMHRKNLYDKLKALGIHH